MKNKELIETQHKFLIDKEWWIEEKDNKYFLFFKHNNKTYSNSVDKEKVEFDNEIISKDLVSLFIRKIELEILTDRLKSYGNHHQ